MRSFPILAVVLLAIVAGLRSIPQRGPVAPRDRVDAYTEAVTSSTTLHHSGASQAPEWSSASVRATPVVATTHHGHRGHDAPVCRYTRSDAARQHLAELLALTEQATIIGDGPRVLDLRAGIVGYFEAHPGDVGLLVELANFGPIPMQIEISRIVRALEHVDQALDEAFVEAKLEKVRAERDALPDHFDVLAAVVLDGTATTKTRSHALRKLIERYPREPAMGEFLGRLELHENEVLRAAAVGAWGMVAAR